MRWQELLSNTLFLDPRLVADLYQAVGSAVVMPLAFRGTVAEFAAQGATHNNGFPIREGDAVYALWGMRPSRDVCSIAAGLPRKALEHDRQRVLGGLDRAWTPHHVHLCGPKGQPVPVRAGRFTNLANLVLMAEDFHRMQSRSVHHGPFGEWLRWVAFELHGQAAVREDSPPTRPIGSPGVGEARILELTPTDRAVAVGQLRGLHSVEPAGSTAATQRLR